MTAKQSDTKRLLQENAKLKEELDELREIIRAVKSGEVDALVIQTQQGDKVFTLKTADQTYRSLIEEMHEGAALLSDENTILYCNCSFGKMAKKPINEIIGTNMQNLVSSTHVPNFLGLLKAGRSGSGKKVAQITLTASDGTLIPTQMSANTLNLENSTKTAYVVATDLTQHMKEDLKRYTVKLEREVEEKTRELKVAERFAAIGETAGMVGHDLRNPLQTIIGELFLAKDVLGKINDGPLKEQMKETMNIIEDQVLYMNKIVVDLQDYARTIRPEPKPTNLQQLLKEVLRDTPISKTVAVKTKIQNDLPEFAIDPQMTKRVLVNLISNAIQAIPEKGEVTIEAAQKNNTLHLVVRDTGVGIPDEVKPKLFLPLFTTKAKGQGLGLAVVKRLVEAQKGEISFQSEKGKGTAFTVKIPSAQTAIANQNLNATVTRI